MREAAHRQKNTMKAKKSCFRCFCLPDMQYERNWAKSAKHSAAVPRSSNVKKGSRPSSQHDHNNKVHASPAINTNINQDATEDMCSAVVDTVAPPSNPTSEPQCQAADDSEAFTTSTSTTGSTDTSASTDTSTPVKHQPEPQTSSATSIDTDLVVDVFTQQTTSEVS